MSAAKKLKRPGKGAQPLSARAFEAFAAKILGQFAEVRAEFRGEFENVRAEFRGEFENVRAEFRGEFASVREESRTQFKALDGRITDLRDHMDQRFAQVDRRFDGIEQDIARLQDSSREHGRQLRLVQQNKVDREEVEVIVERVLARDPRR